MCFVSCKLQAIPEGWRKRHDSIAGAYRLPLANLLYPEGVFFCIYIFISNNRGFRQNDVCKLRAAYGLRGGGVFLVTAATVLMVGLCCSYR